MRRSGVDCDHNDATGRRGLPFRLLREKQHRNTGSRCCIAHVANRPFRWLHRVETAIGDQGATEGMSMRGRRIVQAIGSRVEPVSLFLVIALSLAVIVADANRRLSPELRLDPLKARRPRSGPSISRCLACRRRDSLRALCRHTRICPDATAERGHRAQVGVVWAHRQERVMRRLVPVLIVCLVAAPAFAQAPVTDAQCEALTRLAMPHASITQATVERSGTFHEEHGPGGKPHDHTRPAAVLPRARHGHAGARVDDRLRDSGCRSAAGAAGCRRSATAPTTIASTTRRWRSALRAGDVAVGTDTGHKGGDLKFGVGHPEAIVDWGGGRAVHESTWRPSRSRRRCSAPARAIPISPAARPAGIRRWLRRSAIPTTMTASSPAIRATTAPTSISPSSGNS